MLNSAAQTVFVVDDDAGILKALDRLLRSAGFEVRTFQSAEAFLEQHDPATPGCALLDVVMDGIDGLGVQKKLAASSCDRPVVFLTGHGDIPMSVQAMMSGAVNFLTKPAHSEDLFAAIHIAIDKDAKTREARKEQEVITGLVATLTRRENEVLRHVIAGHLNKVMAAAMGVAMKTIKVHRARMMKKMGVRTVADLVRMADKAGIIAVREGSLP